MDVTKILDKDKERFNILNEQINSYIETYGEKTTIAMIKNKLFEEGETNNQAPAPAPAQQGNSQQPAQQNNNSQAQQGNDLQNALQEFSKIGQQFQEFIKKYPNLPQMNDLNTIFENMKKAADAMKANNNQQQAAPAQQGDNQQQDQQNAQQQNTQGQQPQS